MTPNVLEVRNITKSFPGVKALKGVNLEVRENEIVGLIGENGAGKSTLLKILVGLQPPDSGDIILRGEKVNLRSVKEANKMGIGMVFQEQSLLPNISVSENIFLGNEEDFLKNGVIQWKKMHAAARKQLKKVETDIDPHMYTGDLDFAARQMVEIAKVLSLEERINDKLVIILDEPTSVLSKSEVEILFKRMRTLKQRASMIFVSHRLDEVLEISDRIYVFKDGRNVGTFATKEVDIPKLHSLMVGRGLQSEYYRESQQRSYSDKVVLKVDGLSKKGKFNNVSFDLHEGEILGICGVLGSGKEELCRVLAGVEKTDEGKIYVLGKEVAFDSPADAIEVGIGYIPKERRVEGMIGSFSVAGNISLSNLNRVKRGCFLIRGLEKKLAQQWIDQLKIKTPSENTPCANLSGGNQQKVVLAKWLTSDIKILILDHPTRGIDVGAKEEVYELVRNIVEKGMSIILTSDTLEEAIGLSNTIMIMRDGKVEKVFDAPPGRKPAQIDIISYMV